LTSVEKIVFVLEGNLEGHILTKSVGEKGYGCWAIMRNDEIDKSWISEVENFINLQRYGLNNTNVQKLVEISKQHSAVKKYLEMHPNATYEESISDI